jgi:hypothetical protein
MHRSQCLYNLIYYHWLETNKFNAMLHIIYIRRLFTIRNGLAYSTRPCNLIFTDHSDYFLSFLLLSFACVNICSILTALRITYMFSLCHMPLLHMHIIYVCLLTLGHISAYNMDNTILLLLLLWMSLVILKNEICLKCIDSINIGK